MELDSTNSMHLAKLKDAICHRSKRRTIPNCPSPILINRYLYSKYSSSQDFFYSKEITDILADGRVRSSIEFNDLLCILKSDEFLRRFYYFEDISAKLHMLFDYYKYHEDVPRLFMKDLCDIIHNFYDKKRRINYLRITNVLNMGNEENVKIHDSESLAVTLRSVGSSMAKLLPSDFLNKSTRTHSRTTSSKSFTIQDLNDALGPYGCISSRIQTPKARSVKQELKIKAFSKAENHNILNRAWKKAISGGEEENAQFAEQMLRTRNATRTSDCQSFGSKVPSLNINNLNININFHCNSRSRSKQKVLGKIGKAKPDSPFLSTNALLKQTIEAPATKLGQNDTQIKNRGKLLLSTLHSPVNSQFRSLPNNIMLPRQRSTGVGSPSRNILGNSHRHGRTMKPSAPDSAVKTNRSPNQVRMLEAFATGVGSKAAKFKKFLQQDQEAKKLQSTRLEEQVQIGASNIQNKPRREFERRLIAPSLDFRKKGKPSVEISTQLKQVFHHKDRNEIEPSCSQAKRKSNKSSRPNIKGSLQDINFFTSQEARSNKRSVDAINFTSSAIKSSGIVKVAGIGVNSQSPAGFRKNRLIDSLLEEPSIKRPKFARTFEPNQKHDLGSLNPQLKTASESNYSLFQRKFSVPDSSMHLRLKTMAKG